MTSPAPAERHDHTAHLRAVHDQTFAAIDEAHHHQQRLAALRRIDALFEQARATDSSIAATHEQVELERIETQIALHTARTRLAALTGVQLVDPPVDTGEPDPDDTPAGGVDERGRRVLDDGPLLDDLTDRLRRGEPLTVGGLLTEYRAGTPRMSRLLAEAKAMAARQRR